MSSAHASAAAALMPLDRGIASASTLQTADDVAAAFLAGFGASTRESYGRDLRAWGSWLKRVSLEPLDAHRVHVEAWMRRSDHMAAAMSMSSVARSMCGGGLRTGVC